MAVMAIPAGDIAPVVLTIVITIAVAATIILRGPLGKGLARAMEVGAGAAVNPEHDARMAQLEQRVTELESVHGRLAELEERVDFAERLLTRGETAGRLPEIRGRE
jgi:hypothetical protein